MPSLTASPVPGRGLSQTDPSLRDDLKVAPELLSVCRRVAWDLYKARNLAQAEIVSRGLVASDPADWYHHALLAATLQKQRRFPEALAQVDEGLVRFPGQLDLVVMRAEIFTSSKRLAEAERRLALQLPTASGLSGSDEFLVDNTPKPKRTLYLEMIRLVTGLLENQEGASSAALRNLRM